MLDDKTINTVRGIRFVFGMALARLFRSRKNRT